MSALSLYSQNAFCTMGHRWYSAPEVNMGGLGVGIWNSSGGSSFNFADNETPSGAINGSNAVFTLAHAPTPAASLELTKNRITLIQGTDFTVSGSTITYLAGSIPQTGDIHVASYRF